MLPGRAWGRLPPTSPAGQALSALAYDRGEDYDTSQPIAADLLETLSLVQHAGPVIGEAGSYELARQRRREPPELSRIPD
jgi:hypothetical protein